MAIIGMHALVYTPEAEAVRALFRDVLGWSHVEDGDGSGWLIFKLPPAEVGVHPSEGNGDQHHELCLMCDDLDATVTELTAKGVVIEGEPNETRFGRLVTVVLPGDLKMMLYEPRHKTAI
jgi:catechol 2,3-dioxygenase-like lactoylglutathione lyase family enzyme